MRKLILLLLLLAVPLFGATHRVSMLGFQLVPNDDEVYFESYDVTATNDVWDALVLIFEDGSTRTGVAGIFTVPQNYVDTANLVIVWSSTATSGDVEWDLDYRAVGGNDTESLDQSGTQEAVNTNDTAPSATNERMEITIALTDGNLAAGDVVLFELFRDKTDAGDTMAADAYVIEVYFEYNDA